MPKKKEPTPDPKLTAILVAVNTVCKTSNTPELQSGQLLSILTACALDGKIRNDLITLLYSAADIANKSTERLRKEI